MPVGWVNKGFELAIELVWAHVEDPVNQL